jgi:preprotein translocase subunit SecD
MDFRMVDSSVPADQALQGRVPPDSEVLPGAEPPNTPYVIKKQVLVPGGDLIDAQPGFDQRTNEPVVNFRFNTSGARKFSEATLANVGQPFAIVLDQKVISAPVIREPITGGSGQISGSFTVQAANDLAILLRAGALPAPLTIIEERTVGPGLGADSIAKGELAAYVGSILVIIFMLLTYRLFGLFANIAVAINVAMIFGVLSLLNATLTLPGIAGIVLTVGIAVDSNVLIYERIREELRGGRTAISAIDAGFKRALSTILDSNITTFIAAAVLFYIGTGPVRGFAVTLGIGIVTTVFTAFTVTRLIVAAWVRWKRPTSVPICDCGAVCDKHRSHRARRPDRRAELRQRDELAAVAAHRPRRYQVRLHPVSPHQLSDLRGAVDSGHRAVLHPRAELRHRLQGRHAARSPRQDRNRRHFRDALHARRPWPRRSAVAAVRRPGRRADPRRPAARRR